MNSVNVTWIADSLAPSAWLRGTVKRVHAYWRFAIASIATMPAASFHQRSRTWASLLISTLAMERPPDSVESFGGPAGGRGRESGGKQGWDDRLGSGHRG